MAFEKGHKKSVGNKGGGRASAYQELQEAVWHADAWKIDSDVPALQAKLKTGKYSVRDVFLAKALQGNERILGIFANKLLPDLVDHTTGGQPLPTPILPLGYVRPDNGNAEDIRAYEADTGAPGGNVVKQDGIDALIPDSESTGG